MPRILIGDDTTVPASTRHRDGIRSISKRFKSPTNSVALAAVNSLWQATSDEAAVRAGMNATVARRFLLPFGILPRMGLLASGWVKPGDEFKRAQDKAWWSKRYAHPLWEPLETYATFLDKSGLGTDVRFDEALAQGDIASISDKMAMVADDLSVIRASGSDVCAPYFIPARVGVLPVDNLACQTRLNIKPIGDEVDRRAREVFGQPIPWWVWVLLGIAATKKLSR